MDYLHDSHRSMFARLLPSAIGAMLSETVASLIDTIILSNYLGPDMLSTISICMPIYMFVNVLSMLIVSGGATLFAQALGKGDREEAQRCYTCSIVLMVLCGAALATCLAYTVAMLINACRLLQKGNGLVLRRGSLSCERIRRLLKTGVPLSVTQLGMAVGTSLFNIRIMDVGGATYLDVYGVITQLSVVAMALYEGIAQACQPIMAACFGAGDRRRMDQTIRYGFVMEIIAMTLAILLYVFGAGFVASLFSIQETALRDVAVHAIRVYALSLLFTGFNTVIIYYFQVQERELNATGISLLSGTVLPVAFLYLLTALFGVAGIWWCYLIAQGLTLILSAVLYKRDRRAVAARLTHDQEGA